MPACHSIPPAAHRGLRLVTGLLPVALVVLVGCDFHPRMLFSRPRLPAYEFDFGRYRPTPTADRADTAAVLFPDLPQDRQWRYIVIHHSATASGNARMFDASHRRRGWDELGYHFVIDNGHGGPDGRLEIGARWARQKCGAHCGGTDGNEYNEKGIGICLVGKFDRSPPSGAQLASLQELVAKLAGRYEIPAENVITHREAPNARTQCPGDALHTYIIETLRPRLARRSAGE